jgi:hypothetical protein
MYINKNIIKTGLILCFTALCHMAFCQISFQRQILSSSESIKDTVKLNNGSLKLIHKVLPDIFVDTLRVKGDDYRITHYHIVSNEINRTMVMDSTDEIFNNTSNHYSRLVFEGPSNHSFNIPTIPLTHIIYLRKMGLIIGLSKIVVSPYHIVIYSTEGKLLCKRTLNNLELKFNKKEINDLFKFHLKLRGCLSQNVIVKENEDYYIEASRCLLQIAGRETLLKMNKIVTNHYFPAMGHSMDGNLYSKYYNSFSDSDPFYDIIMIGSVPYVLILNSEDGSKVNIPLLSSKSLLDWEGMY